MCVRDAAFAMGASYPYLTCFGPVSHGVPTFNARLHARLPSSWHWQGEPNAWVRMTRPGQSLHSFLEGLTFAPDGTAFVADVPYGRVFRIDARDGQWTCVLDDGSEPHGLWYVSDSRLLMVDYARGLRTLDPTTQRVEVLCESAAGVPFHGLSDLAVDGDGDVWFTDPGRSSLSDSYGRVFRYSRAGILSQVLDRLPYPNGVAITDDGAQVFVAVTRANAVWKFARTGAGAGTPMLGHYLQLGGGLGPDGLAIGAHGCLAVAHAQAGCAWLYNALGLPLARITVPEGHWTTSVRFSPRARDHLYIVEAQTGSIYEFDCSGILGDDT